VPFVIGYLPTSTIAIQLTWSEWHKLRKPEKADTGAYSSTLNHSVSPSVMNSMVPSSSVR
jgi:hypothetical protein